MLLPLEHITQISAEKRIMHYRNCTIIVGEFQLYLFCISLTQSPRRTKRYTRGEALKGAERPKDPDGRPAIRRNTCIHTQNPHADLFPTVYNGRKNKSAINPRGWRWQRWKCINKYICIAQARNSLVDLLEF